MTDFVYQREGDVLHPTKWAGSPWSTSMQHGAPVNGLFAREFEAVGTRVGMQCARITIDLFKAVPMAPLVVRTRTLREGKRIAAVESVLCRTDDDSAVSRATGLLLRAAPHPERHWQTPECPPPAFEATERRWLGGGDRPPVEMPPGFHESIEARAGVDQAGPFVWMTTRLGLVEGEHVTPLQRATALTDMTLGNGMHARTSRGFASGPMINTDTTVYWERPCVGESLCFRSVHIAEQDGIGSAEAVLYDADGRVGRALQTALVQSFTRPSRKSP